MAKGMANIQNDEEFPALFPLENQVAAQSFHNVSAGKG